MKRTLLTSFLLVAALTVSAQKKSAPQQDWLDQALAQKAKVEKSSVAGLPYTSAIFKGGTPAGHVELNVKGLNELILITDPADDGTDFDHAAWAGAVFIDKDGKEHRLDQEKFKSRYNDGDWFQLNAGFGGKPITIAGKSYPYGVLSHAYGRIVVDLTGKNYVTFKSDIGVDQGGRGKVQFQIYPTTGRAEADELLKVVPAVQTNLLSVMGINPAVWIINPGTDAERNAVLNIANLLQSPEYFQAEAVRIEKLTDRKARIREYLDLYNRAKRTLNVETQISWLNPGAVNAAFADFSTTKGYDKGKYQTLLNEFNKLATPFHSVQKLTQENLEEAVKALALKREIMLSNPAMDMDKILVTRYKLGSRARSAMAPNMGTQPNNWSCQLSASRGGFDAEIVELSNLRGGKIAERSVYKPADDGVITDVMLHWNGDRMMFTGNDKTKHFQVFEVGLDGQNFKQVINVPDSDLEFFDATYLPSGKVIAASNIGYHGVPCVNGSDAVGNYSLYDPSTGDMRRLTYDQDNNWNANVLKNGKVMYTRWEYTDLMHYYSRIVFTMNPDGTEQKAYFGSGAMFPNSTFDMQQLPENTNRFIGVISGHHGIARSGRLIIFDPTKARKGVEGMIQEIPHSKRPIIPLVKDELVNDVWPQFLKPHPLNDNYYLVTAKLTPTSLWGIYLVDIFDNMTLVAECEGEGLINPIPVRTRPMPAVIPETVPQKIKDCPKEATVFIQDIYEGEGLPGVPRGTVKELRVLSYEFAYLRSLSDHVNNGVQSGWDIKRELGRVKVNPDGSAIFTIPANTPISLQPLDSTGAAIQLMRSWFVGMPGETVSCVGCHEDQNMVPKPVRTMASKQKPAKIQMPEGGIRPFTFENEIQPILTRACTACHNGDKLAGGIDYTGGRMYEIKDWAGTREFSKSYLAFHPYFYRQGPEAEMAVLNPYEYSATNSEMIQMLRKGHHNVTLTPKEWERLITWLDFNVPYHSTFAADPYKAQDGETYNQKERRIELSVKYSGAPVNWEQELTDYAAHLAKQPKPTPTMPEASADKAPRAVKAKGWPFTAEQAAQMVAGKDKKVIDLGGGESLTFVYIPAGTYVAGGNGKLGTLAPHKVAIKKGFWMADKEISNAQMRALLPTHSSRYIGQQWKDHTTPGYNVDSNYFAATKVSREDALLYTKLLSEKTGLKATIPTEAQWEWAARSGTDGDFWYGTKNTDFAPYENLADRQLTKMAVSGIDPRPMSHKDPWYPLQSYIPKDESVNDGHMLMAAPGKYKPNPWGLYDINGNVAEWTNTPEEGTQQYIVKGGSWYDRAKKARTADRRAFLPWQRVWNVGFRPIIED